MSVSVDATDDANSDILADRLAGKIIVGYQGWFGCPGDFGGNRSWIHWFQNNVPDAPHLRIDLLPEVSEYPKDARCATALKRPDGSRIELYSGVHPGTIDLHFRWMAQYGIDGAALQRFVVVTGNSQSLARWDHELQEEREAAEKNRRVFFVSYDVSGGDAKTVTADIETDWRHLVRDLKITSSASYLHDGGKPVLELWGFGVTDRPGAPDQVASLIGALKSGAPGVPPVTLIGGVAPEWRTLNGSSKTDPAWTKVYRKFDVISPWFTGRFKDDLSAIDYFKARVLPDLTETRRLGIGYMPVIFPGFSWSNLMRLDVERPAMVNAIPRRCGNFYWTQIWALLGRHVSMLYVAMFDEVDEGTAIFKIVARPSDLPVGSALVDLDQESCNLPADWYLRITGAAQRFMATGVAPPRQLDHAIP